MHTTTTIEKWPKTIFIDTEPRAEGLHLSDIIRLIMVDAGMAPKAGGGFDDLELAAEIGLLWEDVLSAAMRDKYAIRPPQICADGIWMSPDGIAADPWSKYPLVVEEYKATWLSSNKCPTSVYKYMAQVKSYCRALGTECTVMRIFHIMGNYRGSGPLYKVARIEFTQQELDENWALILRYRDKMRVGGEERK